MFKNRLSDLYRIDINYTFNSKYNDRGYTQIKLWEVRGPNDLHMKKKIDENRLSCLLLGYLQ